MMTNSFGFQLVYASEPISVLRSTPGERVEWNGLDGIFCTKGAGRFSRHATINSLIKQTLGSLDFPSCSSRVDCVELIANGQTKLQ